MFTNFHNFIPGIAKVVINFVRQLFLGSGESDIFILDSVVILGYPLVMICDCT